MTYTITVTREGKWWMVSIPELDGLTQARRLSEVELMAKEYIAVTLDVPIESVSVEVKVDRVGAVTNIQDMLKTIVEERARALELERDATQRAARLARALVEQDVPLRDVGAVLGVSHQRAHQLSLLSA